MYMFARTPKKNHRRVTIRQMHEQYTIAQYCVHFCHNNKS